MLDNHITMSDQHYIDQSDRYGEPIPQRCSPSIQPPTTAYPEPTYSVNTFSQPQQSEPHLLTPVSGIGSPSFQESTKMMQHHPSTTASMYQSSPAGWPGTFEMSAPHSQAPSPLPVMQTTKSHFDQTYVSIKDEMPEPPAPYFGSYGVSEQPNSSQGSLSPPMHNTFYPLATGASIFEPNPMMTGQDLAMVHQHPFPPSHQFPLNTQTPAYPSNNFTGGRDDTVRRQSHELPYPSQINSQSDSSSERPRVRRLARMRSRAGESPKPTAQSGPQPPATDDQPDELLIRPNCPPQERFLFNRRHQLDGRKGEIWAIIRDEFNEKFQSQSRIEGLQMRLRRGRSQFLDWPKADDDKLEEAFIFAEAQYYKTLYMKFRHLDGGKTARWGQADIEARMVELGWANRDYEPAPMEPSVKIRRRKKLSVRHQASETMQMTEAQRAEMIDDIIATRGLELEREEEEDELIEMQQTRLQRAQAKATRGAKQQTREEVMPSSGRVTRNLKPSTAKAKGRARTHRSRAA